MTLQVVRSLKVGMGLVKNLSSQAGIRVPCAPDIYWSEKANEYAREAIDTETDRLNPRSWEDRRGLHEAVAKRIVERLNIYLDIEDRNTFAALAYLPYADDERHGFVTLPYNFDVVRNQSKSVNYMVSFQAKSSLGRNITSQWTIIENAREILDATFSTLVSNLTNQMEEVENQFFPFLTDDGFRAFAALRCGHEFVWYELGHRDFPAGFATGSYALFTQGDSKYSADKCGQIVFFP